MDDPRKKGLILTETVWPDVKYTQFFSGSLFKSYFMQ